MIKLKRPLLCGGWILLGIALFFCTVCTPVRILAMSDIQISETAFPTVWDLFQTLVQYVFYWVAIAFLILLFLERGIVRSLPLLAYYLGASVIRSVGGAVVGELMVGDGIGSDLFWENMSYGFLDCLLDLLIFGTIVLIVFLLLLSKSTAKNATFEYPPAGFFAPFDRLKVAVLVAVAFPSASQVIGRIRYDILFGAPQNSVDLLQMILFYLSDLLFFCLGYLFVLLLLRLTLSQKEKEPLTHV